MNIATIWEECRARSDSTPSQSTDTIGDNNHGHWLGVETRAMARVRIQQANNNMIVPCDQQGIDNNFN